MRRRNKNRGRGCRRRKDRRFLVLILIWLTSLIIFMAYMARDPREAAPDPEPAADTGIILQELAETKAALARTQNENEALWSAIRMTKDYIDLTRTVEAEAQGEGYEGKLAVAEVIINRVQADSFGGTIHEVLYAPGQFTPVMTGKINRVIVTEETIKAVDQALLKQTHDALYFMNPAIANKASRNWMRTKTFVAIIGNQEFYK